MGYSGRLYNAATGQLLRYGVTGLAITGLGAAIYYSCAEYLGIAPLIANTIAWLTGIIVGYAVHSQFTFRGHGRREDIRRTGLRFAFVNVIGYVLNSLWVWLLVDLARGSNWWPIVPMIAITPVATFVLHRRWTFG